MPILNPIWSSAIFIGQNPLGKAWELPDAPQILLETRVLKWSKRAIHTIADPFVIAVGKDLYLFAEVQRRGEAGRIESWQVSPDLSLAPRGEVDFAPGHVSYPFVFQHQSDLFIIPETGSIGEVALYRFVKFPTTVEKVSQLLAGPYVDSSIFQWGGVFYLFTSNANAGLIFVSEALEGPYRPHPKSPFSNDQRYLRCGGAIAAPSNERPFPIRPAQNCSHTYGGDLSLMKVLELSPEEYREES